MTRRITWPVGGSVSAATSDVDDFVPLPVNGAPLMATDPRVPTIPQAAIANVATGAMVLLADTITALTATRATLNTLLAELRTAGILSP